MYEGENYGSARHSKKWSIVLLSAFRRSSLIALENIIVEVEDEPSQEVWMIWGSRMTPLRIVPGTPLTEREWNFGNVLPDRIAIYRGPIVRDARTDEETEEIVLDTVMHEIGHYFGFDDETLYGIEEEKAEKRERGKGGGGEGGKERKTRRKLRGWGSCEDEYERMR